MKTHFPSLFLLSAAPCAFARGVMSEAFSIDEGGVAKVFNEEVAAGVFFEECAQQVRCGGNFANFLDTFSLTLIIMWADLQAATFDGSAEECSRYKLFICGCLLTKVYGSCCL